MRLTLDKESAGSFPSKLQLINEICLTLGTVIFNTHKCIILT